MNLNLELFQVHAQAEAGVKPRAALCRVVLGLGTVALFCALHPAKAAPTDIANVPLQTASSTQVKPNIMFILDNSTSMDLTFIPEGFDSGDNRLEHDDFVPGFRNHLCNTLYYDPDTPYALPVRQDGTPFPTPSFTSASINGYITGSSARNLENQFAAGTWNTTTYDTLPDGPDSGNARDPVGAYYYRWKGAGKPTANDCEETLDDMSDLPGDWTAKWQRITHTSPAAWGDTAKQNFANWHAYYRTRMLAMKYATSKAFLGVDDAVRVGFITINPGGPVQTSKYLKIDAFTAGAAGHKKAWYDKLFSQTTTGSTPLRQALSRVGRHYAKRTTGINEGMNEDPMQYFCQRNYAILTTDGYWNQDTTHPGVNLAGSNFTSTSDYDGQASDPLPLRDADKVGHTLADVAMYYYETDLRTADLGNATGVLNLDVAKNLEPPKDPVVLSEEDNALHQHMTTFTFALGVSGTLGYHPDYKFKDPKGIEPSPSADFEALRKGTKKWPSPFSSSLQNEKRIDDLWHAAVNGRGQYFSAGKADTAAADLQRAIFAALATKASTGGSSVSSAAPNPDVENENLIFTAFNKLAEWSGDLEAWEVKVEADDGVPDDTTQGLGLPTGTEPLWTAESQISSRVGEACDNRMIYLFNASAPDKLKEFKWDTFTCGANKLPTGSAVTTLDATERAHFNKVNAIDNLSHRPVMSTSPNNQPVLAAGPPLVNYIRGQSKHEEFVSGDPVKFFRDRAAILGDFVNSGATFVGEPFFVYNDTLNPGYTAFKTEVKNRDKAVYVASNDGMMHAFNAVTGQEIWAFIPSIALPTLYTRANNNLQNNHKYLLDGTPVIADVEIGGSWKTIMVAPMGRGATGYYAIDITNPKTPKALWEFKAGACAIGLPNEFTDCDLGKSIGAPVITKRVTGTGTEWIVLVTSGLNNTTGSNPGKGFLYMLKASTGEVIDKIATNAGDAATPSGLAEISAYLPAMPNDNIATRVYGGDMLGNVWRFDLKGDTGLPKVSKLATLKDSFGTPQPVTAKPGISRMGIPIQAFVVVPTGRYLGITDLTNTSVQSVYAFYDNLEEVVDPRAVLARRVLVDDELTRDIECPPTGTCSKDPQGWYADFPETGERGNIQPVMLNGTLVVASNIPTDTPCDAGGSTWVTFFDAETGGEVPGFDDAGFTISDAMTTGITFQKFGDNIRLIGTLSGRSDKERKGGVDGRGTGRYAVDVPTKHGGFENKRLSWRELIRN
jgi:type IV pilus assembly protein PilY1